MTEKSIWHIVKDCAKGIGMPKLAPHDLRRTCARLCHAAGGELEQIQFLLGHVSVQRPSDTLAASSGFSRRSMIASELNQIAESAGGSGRVADKPPGTRQDSRSRLNERIGLMSLGEIQFHTL
jgi:hypothetical protein